MIDRFYPGIPQTRPIEGHGTFYANDKARRMVGFAPRHGWRDL